MSIGYACLAIAVPGSDMKSCILKNASEERLLSLIGYNLDALERLIDYNANNGIGLFRISSDLIPFGSSEAAQLPWGDVYAQKLKLIGSKIVRAGMRVSMHPGQYTVLNSTEPSVAQRAVEDLHYHTKVLDCLGLGLEHKLVLHLGGVYGDKSIAKSRFVSRCKELTPNVRNRLVLENDDKLFDIADVLETALAAGIPAVFDTLHHAVNPPQRSLSPFDWIDRCAASWGERDGAQKIHYSQQHDEKRRGAHAQSIRIDAFLEWYRQLSGSGVDIMLEVKDKNKSALKCINCVSNRGIRALETEWGRYKYCVLERSPEAYQGIRRLLKDKGAYPAPEMYRMIETALDEPLVIGNAVNAAQHVWGYFKEQASSREKEQFHKRLQAYTRGETNIQTVKRNLLRLACKYQEDYLLNGYYFYE